MAAIDRRTRASGAIQTLAAELGLPTDVTVVSERWNTVARLGESDVIVKVATLAELSRLDPLHWFEQEVRVSTELTALGAPVQVPWDGIGSYHIRDGLPMTLWQRIDGEVAGSAEPDLVDSLAKIHRLGAGIVLHQPWFATITVEVPGTLEMLADRGVFTSAHTAMLNSYLARLVDVVETANLPSGFVHGDAQRKNSLHTTEGTVWIDFEEVCIGPLAWDLACLTMNPQFDSNRVLDRYALVSGTDRVTTAHLDVLKRLRDLEGLVWMLAIQHEREPAFQQEAAVQLSRVLHAANDG